MKKLIYISGPITDNKTGQPREGWQKDFQGAEEKLRSMGFDILTPCSIAEKVELKLRFYFEIPTWKGVEGNAPEPPRWFYLLSCLEAIQEPITIDWIGSGREQLKMPPLEYKSKRPHGLLGIYVIGDLADISVSYGTMCEINFALAAGLPVWSQYYNGYQMNNMLWQKTEGITLAEAARSINDDRA